MQSCIPLTPGRIRAGKLILILFLGVPPTLTLGAAESYNICVFCPVFDSTLRSKFSSSYLRDENRGNSER